MSSITIYKRRLIASYFSVVINSALILFLLSLFGFFFLNTNSISNYFKEQIIMTVFFDDDIKTIEKEQILTTYKLSNFTKDVKFISKESAAAEHSKVIGEDFMDFLGYNPLKDAIDIRLKAEFLTTELLDSLSDIIAKKPFVYDVIYDRPLIILLNENIDKFSYWILIFFILFSLIALILINHSIKLSIYSKRLVIQTMFLVGAKKSFINKPFILKYIFLGLISALISSTGLFFSVKFFLNQISNINNLMYDESLFLVVFISIFLSIFISGLSAFLSVRKHLNLKNRIIY
ncbi:MAG: cell division protein FtsX [Flavobacteriales bacterium]|nr:cell division protein FtsX [Flavobacteriales bacterium]